MNHFAGYNYLATCAKYTVKERRGIVSAMISTILVYEATAETRIPPLSKISSTVRL